jgi:hypothetical protein
MATRGGERRVVRGAAEALAEARPTHAADRSRATCLGGPLDTSWNASRAETGQRNNTETGPETWSFGRFVRGERTRRSWSYTRPTARRRAVATAVRWLAFGEHRFREEGSPMGFGRARPLGERGGSRRSPWLSLPAALHAVDGPKTTTSGHGLVTPSRGACTGRGEPRRAVDPSRRAPEPHRPAEPTLLPLSR